MDLKRKIWRHRWLDSICELTSLRLQKETWLNSSNTNPHSSFIEFMSSYFDDLLIDKDYPYFINLKWLTTEEFEIIKVWHTELNNYKSPNDDDYDHVAILSDENWLTLIRKGGIAREKLTSLLDSEEKEIIKHYLTSAKENIGDNC